MPGRHSGNRRRAAARPACRYRPRPPLPTHKYLLQNIGVETTFTSETGILILRGCLCTVCHMPEGHRKMNKLTLLQTPYHAVSAIDAVLDEVRSRKMPVDDYNDPKPLPPKLKVDLLTNGEAFKQLIAKADAWEATNNRPKARKAPPQ